MSYIIAADELKKSLPGYSPDKSEDYHSESAKLADIMYSTALKERKESKVILMSGGTASGKSEYVSEYLKDDNAIIVDGTLPTLNGAKIKIKAAQKAKKTAEIRLVLPESLLVAFVAFLNRDRKFGNDHFFRTHSSSRKTVLEIAQNFPDIPIKIFYSKVEYEKGESKMSFREVIFSDHSSLVEFLVKQQYNEEDIKQEVFNK
jgi:hypothetical protein